jgi:GcrA cell cycle regulator
MPVQRTCEQCGAHFMCGPKRVSVGQGKFCSRKCSAEANAGWDSQILRDLWAEGVPAAEIGRRIHKSKNAVIGKAHRLGLVARPSPIKPTGNNPRRSRVPRAYKVKTLPTLACLAPEQKPESKPILASRRIAQKKPPQAPPPMPSYGRICECCWPIGEPGDSDFRFCDAPSAPGKPYCAAHCARAYAPSSERQVELAA